MGALDKRPTVDQNGTLDREYVEAQMWRAIEHTVEQRDAARADAERLAAAAVAYIDAIEADSDDSEHEAVGIARDALDAALAAHDALTAETEGA